MAHYRLSQSLEWDEQYLRALSVAKEAGSLASVLIVAGTALVGGDWAWIWRALLIVAIVWVTMPVASHVLARAALRERLARGEAAAAVDRASSP